MIKLLLNKQVHSRNVRIDYTGEWAEVVKWLAFFEHKIIICFTVHVILFNPVLRTKCKHFFRSLFIVLMLFFFLCFHQKAYFCFQCKLVIQGSGKCFIAVWQLNSKTATWKSFNSSIALKNILNNRAYAGLSLT